MGWDEARWLGHNDWVFNRKFTTMSPSCAANNGTLIEVYCAMSSHEACCGLCNNTNISGVAQVIWQFLTSLLISSAIVLNPGEAWGIIVLQMLLITSQYVSIWGPMFWYQKSINHWEAYMQFPLSMGCIPILVSLLFSPVWKQGGRSVASLHELKTRTDARQFLHGPRTSVQKRGVGRRSLFGRHRHVGMSTSSGERHGMGELLAKHAERPLSLRFWGATLASVWLVDLWVMVWFYATHIWAGDYVWAQGECDAQAAASESALKTSSIVMISFLFCATIWQVTGSFHPPWSAAELVSALSQRYLRRRSTTQRGKSAPAKGGNLIVWQLDHPWKAQTAAAGLTYCCWAGVTAYLFLDAIGADGVVIIGDDPFTFGQIEMFVILSPHVLAFTRAVRARLDNNRIDLALASKNERMYAQAIADLRALEGDPVDNVYNRLDYVERSRGRSQSPSASSSGGSRRGCSPAGQGEEWPADE